MIIECKGDQYIIENKKNQSRVTEWGRQRWTLLLQRCASRKFQVIDVRNTRDQTKYNKVNAKKKKYKILWEKRLLIYFTLKLNDKETRFEINENCSYSRFFKRNIIICSFVSQNWFQNSKGSKVKQPNISLE